MDVTILQADLFATKGMEYAAVLLYLGLFVGFWRLLRNPKKAGVAAQMRGTPGDEAGAGMDTTGAGMDEAGAAMDTTGAGARGWFTLPEGLLHHQGHTWVRPNGGRTVTVGMNEFARKLVGAPEGITLPPVGTRLEQGHHAWELNIDGTVIPMVSPVDGEVLEMNPRALEAPGDLLEDPYDEGWLLKVGVGESRSRASLKNLLVGSLAQVWMSEVEERIRTQHSGELGVVMPDGGEPVDGLARALSPEDWDKVARQFLLAD